MRAGKTEIEIEIDRGRSTNQLFSFMYKKDKAIPTFTGFYSCALSPFVPSYRCSQVDRVSFKALSRQACD